MLINSKMGTGTYLLDKKHLPLRPDFEDNIVVMDAEDPTSAKAQEKKEKEQAEKAAKIPSAEEVSQILLKSRQDQLSYLILPTWRLEKGLATLSPNQESLERVFETKLHDMDVKVTEIQTSVEKIQEELEERSDKTTTNVYQRVPRRQRSVAVPVTDTRATTSAPAATASVAPTVSTPPAPATSTHAFVLGVLSTPPPQDQA